MSCAKPSCDRDIAISSALFEKSRIFREHFIAGIATTDAVGYRGPQAEVRHKRCATPGIS
jgi:hypothetical protein